MTLKQFGWNSSWAKKWADLDRENLQPGRVAEEDKHHYVVFTADGEWLARVAGKMLHQAQSPANLPKVGDWVGVTLLPGEAKAVIHAVLPRETTLSRKTPGRQVEEQILATNIDVAFIVQSFDRTFNLQLLQRHLVMVFESGARPVVVLNKADLDDNPTADSSALKKFAGDMPVIVVSAKTGKGIDALAAQIRAGETVVFIGTSGVGKSSLANRLCGEEVMPTCEVRDSDAKGRHTTTWRELILLPKGGLIIDTPGLREFHLWLAEEGMSGAFPEIDELAVQCHFRNCTHVVEKKCAVLAALEAGRLEPESYKAYLKLRREQGFLEQEQDRRTAWERKRQTKIAQRAFNKIKRGQIGGQTS
jgi:ribosome biogenesis GTPase